MVFYKRYYKNTKKNFKNYKRTKFSKFNLYTHRSSKNQAKQIYNLNKKINKIEKLTKPEVDQRNGNILYSDVVLSAGNTAIKQTWTTSFSDMLGNLLRIQSFNVFGNINSSETSNFTGYMRLVIVQQKNNNQDFPDDVLLYNSDLSLVRSPYFKGFSQTVRLIYNKVYIINNDKNSANLNIKLNKLNNIRRFKVGDDWKYDGLIKVYAYFVSSKGITITPTINFKLSYIDEGGNNDE